MSLSILFRDELKGFYKSKVMIFLWIGLPALAALLYFVSPDTGEIPFSAFAALLVAAIGGVIAAAMLVVAIINEKEKHVYDLFVIRPIKRRDIVLSKFFAVYLCVVIAGILSILLALLIDYLNTGISPMDMISENISSLIVILSMMAISCSAGVLIGIFSPSILVGVILVIYGANQLSTVAILPVLLSPEQSEFFPLIIGGVITIILLVLSIVLFNRKQF